MFNKTTETAIYVGGIYSVGFAVFHLLFWKLFNWQKNLRSLNPINRGVIQILNLRLIYIFFVVAYLSFFHATELLTTALGKAILFAIALFWLLRGIEQIIFFGFKATASVALFFIFLLGAAIYLYSFWACV